jgi:hypothetical protein
MVRGYKEACVKSLMESFATDAALLARFSTFDTDTLEVKTQFGDVEEYLEGMETDLGIDQGWAANNDDTNIRFSLEGAQEALHQTLHDQPDDIDNALCDGLSRQSNFSHSTRNSKMNSDAAACTPARMENALKNITLVSKNRALTKELALSNVHIIALAKQNQLLQEQL